MPRRRISGPPLPACRHGQHGRPNARSRRGGGTHAADAADGYRTRACLYGCPQPRDKGRGWAPSHGERVQGGAQKADTRNFKVRPSVRPDLPN